MLLICPTFYCLSNIVLLLCFSILSYKYIRGLILILYDQNDILDRSDKTQYGVCLAVCLLVCLLTIWPQEQLLFLIKSAKCLYEVVILYIFLKLTETDSGKAKKAMMATMGLFYLLVIYYNMWEYPEYCLPLSQYLLTVSISIVFSITLYLAFLDLKEIYAIVESRQLLSNSVGMQHLAFGQLQRRRIYEILVIISGGISNFFLLLVDTQQILLNSQDCSIPRRLEGIIPDSLGNVLSYVTLFGLQPLTAYYLIVWRNMVYFVEKPQEHSFRNSGSLMIELDDYRRI